MAADMRPVQRATQGPQPRNLIEIAAGAILVRMADWPFRSATIALGLLLWWSVAWWAGLIALVVGGAVCYLLRRQERAWAQRRRFVRAWRGTPERPGLAHDLDLVNRSGVVPTVTAYVVEAAAGRRVVSFSLPAGITPSMFEQKREVITDALGAHRGEVQQTGPGRVDFVVFDRDALNETVKAEWTREVGPAVPDLPEAGDPFDDDEVPYWLADGDESR